VVGVRYLVIRYKGGEPVVEYATEFLNRAIEEAERLIVNGEKLVSIEVSKQDELDTEEKRLLTSLLVEYLEDTEDAFTCGDCTRDDAMIAIDLALRIAKKLELPMREINKAANKLAKTLERP